MGRELGCLQTPVYMYKINGFNLEVDLVEIKTYKDALKLNKFVDEHGIVDVYMKPTSTEAVEGDEWSTSENSVSSFGASDPDFNESYNVEAI